MSQSGIERNALYARPNVYFLKHKSFSRRKVRLFCLKTQRFRSQLGCILQMTVVLITARNIDPNMFSGKLLGIAANMFVALPRYN